MQKNIIMIMELNTNLYEFFFFKTLFKLTGRRILICPVKDVNKRFCRFYSFANNHIPKVLVTLLNNAAITIGKPVYQGPTPTN